MLQQDNVSCGVGVVTPFRMRGSVIIKSVGMLQGVQIGKLFVKIFVKRNKPKVIKEKRVVT